MEEPHQIGEEGDLRNFSTQANIDIVEGILNDILALPPLDSISNQMLAIETYELAYGIQKVGDSPISLALMKPNRDYVKDSDWERTLSVLMRLKLHNLTGLNILELLDLPRYQLRLLIDVASKVARAEPGILAKMEENAIKAGTARANRM